jgi:hypothetical protein
LAKESGAEDDMATTEKDLDVLLREADDDKTYAAMGIAKTISTVSNLEHNNTA